MILFNIILILILTILTGAVFPKRWNSIKKLVIALLMIFSLNTIIGYFLFAANIQISTGFFSYLYLALSLILLYILFIHGKENPMKLYTWRTTDTAILVSVILLLLVLINPTIKLNSSRLNFGIPTGGDMSNHFFIANKVVQKGTYLYLNTKANVGMPAGLVDYPQASHYNFAILLGDNYNSTLTLHYFRLYYLFCFLVFFALFLNASLDILSKKMRNSYAYIVVCSSALLIFVSTIFASTYLEGFLSQFIGLLVLIALVVVAIEETYLNNKLHWLASIILLNALLAGTWYFISPIALIVSCLAIYRSSYKRSILAYLMVFLVVLPPIIVSYLSGVLTPSTVSASGGISAIPLEYAVLFVAATVFVFWQHGHAQFIALRQWAEVYLVSIIFCMAIGVLQLLTTGRLSYYFLKALYTPFLIMSLLYGIFVVTVIAITKKHLESLPRVFTITVVFIILVGTGTLLIYRYKLRGVDLSLIHKSSYISSTDFSQIRLIAEASKASGKSVILINTGSALNDIVYSRWISAQNLDFTESYGRQLYTNLELAGKSEGLQGYDTVLPNDSTQIIDFRTGSVLK